MSRELVPGRVASADEAAADNVVKLRGQHGNRMLEHLAKIARNRLIGDEYKRLGQFGYMSQAARTARDVMSHHAALVTHQLRDLPYFTENPQDYRWALAEARTVGDKDLQVSDPNPRLPTLETAIAESADQPFVDRSDQLRPSIRQYGRQRLEEFDDIATRLRGHENAFVHGSPEEYYRYLQDPEVMLDDWAGFRMQPLTIDPDVARAAAAVSHTQLRNKRLKRFGTRWYVRTHLPKLRATVHALSRQKRVPRRVVWENLLNDTPGMLRKYRHPQVYDYMVRNGRFPNIF